MVKILRRNFQQRHLWRSFQCRYKGNIDIRDSWEKFAAKILWINLHERFLEANHRKDSEKTFSTKILRRDLQQNFLGKIWVDNLGQ